MNFAFKAVVFDLYSTLVWEDPANPFYDRVIKDLDVEPQAFMRAYRSLGRASMSGDLRSMGERVEAAARTAGFTRPSSLAMEIGEQHLPLWLQSVRLYPDTHDALDLLRRRGFRLGLLSNASSYSEHVLSMTGLRRHFDAAVLSYQIGQMKPSAEAYRFVTDLLGVTSTSCIFIGDGGDQELFGAREYGMTTVLVDRKLQHSEGALKDASFRVSSLLEAANACFSIQTEEVTYAVSTA